MLTLATTTKATAGITSTAMSFDLSGQFLGRRNFVPAGATVWGAWDWGVRVGVWRCTGSLDLTGVGTYEPACSARRPRREGDRM
jgi:hypothetical protein